MPRAALMVMSGPLKFRLKLYRLKANTAMVVDVSFNVPLPVKLMAIGLDDAAVALMQLS